MSVSPRTLRGRLALWYAAIVCVVLLAFGGTALLIVSAEEAKESAAVAALEPPDDTQRQLLIALGVALPAALALAIVGGLWISGRAMAPLDTVVRIASELEATSLERRIPVDERAGAEIQNLTSTLNSMLERLERSVRGMQRFTADASHELRTPLAVLMGEIEVTLRRPREPEQLRSTLESTLDDLGRLSRLVELLLVLARSDAGELPLENVALDARDVAKAAVEPYEAVMAARNIAFQWRAEEAVPICADALWLGRAIANLIDNACKFTPPGGTLVVSVERNAGSAEISVENSHGGISPDERERVFERFFRGKADRGSSEGFGLGLALARDVVRSLGGELSLKSANDAAIVFQVRLPLLAQKIMKGDPPRASS